MIPDAGSPPLHSLLLTAMSARFGDDRNAHLTEGSRARLMGLDITSSSGQHSGERLPCLSRRWECLLGYSTSSSSNGFCIHGTCNLLRPSIVRGYVGDYVFTSARVCVCPPAVLQSFTVTTPFQLVDPTPPHSRRLRPPPFAPQPCRSTIFGAAVTVRSTSRRFVKANGAKLGDEKDRH